MRVSGAAGKEIETAPGSWPIGIVTSPLLNLAPRAATGPRVNQHRPILALGLDGPRGSAMLSLAPDRRSIEVTARLDRPTILRLRRIEPPEPMFDGEELLLLAFYEGGSGGEAFSGPVSFPLDERHRHAPFAPTSALRELPLFWSESRAGSIEGISVEPARAPDSAARRRRDYFRRRMLIEIGAAERSATTVAACRHVELANLYARHLRDGRGSA